MPSAVPHTLTLLRHGLSTANRDQIIQGQLDFPLAADGRRQADALAAYWQATGVRFDCIVTSPLRRARETADILARALRLPVEEDPAWMERRMGEAQGTGTEAFAAVMADEPAPSPYAPFFGSGESVWDLHLRAAGAVQALIRRPQESCLIVSHGAILNAALRAILGLSPTPGAWPVRFRFDNTGYAIVVYNEAIPAWSLERLNDTRHLTAGTGTGDEAG